MVRILMTSKVRNPFGVVTLISSPSSLFRMARPIGDDVEIDRGGYETDSYWKMLYIAGFRLALAKGSVQCIKATADDLFTQLGR